MSAGEEFPPGSTPNQGDDAAKGAAVPKADASDREASEAVADPSPEVPSSDASSEQSPEPSSGPSSDPSPGPSLPPPSSGSGALPFPPSVLIALGVVLVLLLGLMVWLQGVRQDRQTAEVVRTAIEQGQPALEWSVLERRIVEGVPMTLLRIQPRRPDGERGPAVEGMLRGDQVYVELDRIAWTSGGQDPLEIPVFSRLLGLDGAGSALGEEGLLLIDQERPVPFYFSYRGDRAEDLSDNEAELWRELTDPEVEHALTTSHPVPLVIGQQWEAVYRRDGEIELNLLRSTEDRYTYQPDRPHRTSSGLVVRLMGYQRLLKDAGSFDTERVFHAVQLQVANESSADLRLDMNRFQLVDGEGNSYRAASAGSSSVAAGALMNFELLFPLPARAQSPMFTIPGETELRAGEPVPLAISLGHQPAFIGDVESVGPLLVSVQRVDTMARADGFTIELNVQLLNTSWESMELEADDFLLTDLDASSQRTARAVELTPQRLPGWEPKSVAIVFEVGTELTRRDMTLEVSQGRRADRRTAGFVLIDPQVDGRVDGAAHIRQLAGVRHYQRYQHLMERSRGGLFRRLLGGSAAREAEAASHLELAQTLYPESELIAP